ncbi:exopolyphosphatase [Thermoanaerobacterium sp. RBIITD]|uniref:Ppx/GppA phosphatase family protein n=1 Tax=Thermoanaerobacterium sp. RBIITD TaxID=1550240 RepID=UPI000BB76C00|nr:exopolyphosphatase [Thermoanaerobacterium sp. RBIITD]SNX54038.1 exopolyphosphatase / guanosine-5'-triphosphate,3'-diphosphate pyrophosphatase [Thermoanaerobacterium sp. RBIITD]
MRCSVIDIGTNSVRHLICDIDGELIKTVKKDVKITRLGEGVSKSGRLNNDAVIRSIDIIRKYLDDAKDYNVTDIYAFATSAMRDAKDSDYFLDELSKIGLNTDIIDGETESLYGYLGASYGINKKDALVLDIGGGSTEFSYYNDNLIKKSFDIGAVRLTERFIKNDPPTIDEYNNMRLYIIDMLLPFIENNENITCNIIGIGGTITTLAAMSQGLKVYSREKVHGYVLSKNEVKRLLELLMSVKLGERKLINGLQPERADIIIAGTIILITILELLNVNSISASEWDNLEGAVINRFLKKNNIN